MARNEEKKFTFEEVFQQNERRIHYHIHKLGIRDPHREFYVEGIYALWTAYKKFDPNKGPMSTYFNFTIRNRLIDMIRKEQREQRLKEKLMADAEITGSSGNHYVGKTLGKKHDLLDNRGSEMDEVELSELLDIISSVLTTKQMKWFIGRYVHGLKLSEIAEQEGVTVDTVKGWAKQARKKLRGTVPL
ncbi:sigma-70 family RNA polymerase sigma factor [Ornithinibacillus halotolerans]|uniref:Sigma-70 family RNA polymerase sigma factor n=1 Tax=Ornithinibacillus halotolerans TaxID=1274357 RepID=A0A916RPT0_9BACI|nr:sigma-70 family RNA polymerase sigma factor [Ornithinibacillus halotolerans]GGA65303.1 hypothetical protein GCM10008025_06440 [Ornithinibacillus halotolerans]